MWLCVCVCVCARVRVCVPSIRECVTQRIMGKCSEQTEDERKWSVSHRLNDNELEAEVFDIQHYTTHQKTEKASLFSPTHVDPQAFSISLGNLASNYAKSFISKW